jgi:hypothetical protein
MSSGAACDSLWMLDTVSKRRPFGFIFSLEEMRNHRGAMSGEYGGWGTITMLLLVTNSVVSCEQARCHDEEEMWRMSKFSIKIFWHTP